MMKKALVLVLALAAIASATTVSFVGPAPGEPGSAENPLLPSQTIVIPVITDAALLALDLQFTVDGPATVTALPGKAEAAGLGWDPGLSFDPDMVNLEIGLGNFNGNPGPQVAFVEIHCDGPGDIVVSMALAYGFGGSADMNFLEPAVGEPIIIHQLPEPATVALLGLGGLLLRRRK